MKLLNLALVFIHLSTNFATDFSSVLSSMRLSVIDLFKTIPTNKSKFTQTLKEEPQDGLESQVKEVLREPSNQYWRSLRIIEIVQEFYAVEAPRHLMVRQMKSPIHR